MEQDSGADNHSSQGPSRLPLRKQPQQEEAPRAKVLHPASVMLFLASGGILSAFAISWGIQR